jgi:hypothetical protein
MDLDSIQAFLCAPIPTDGNAETYAAQYEQGLGMIQDVARELGWQAPEILDRDNHSVVTVQEAEAESNARRANLFDQFQILVGILDRFEGLIRKRWSKKPKEKRRLVLRKAWPGISKPHRPDFHALRNKRADQSEFKEAYLWPHMNEEELSRSTIFLQLLHARGRNPPAAFLYVDIESAHVGQQTGNLEHRGKLPSLYYVSFKVSSRETYGRIVYSPSYVDFFSGESMMAADGLRVLEIQERVMEFLVESCREILADKRDDLTSSPVLPQLPPPMDGDPEWRSISTLALDAPYTTPQSVELKKLRKFVEVRLYSAKDHLFSLREDPSYYADSIIEWFDHQVFRILDKNKKSYSETTTVAREKNCGENRCRSTFDLFTKTYTYGAYCFNSLTRSSTSIASILNED